MPYSNVLTITKITATATSSTLATLKGSSLNSGLQAVMLVPDSSSDAIYWNAGAAASASTAPVPDSGLVLPITKNLADTIQLYADSKVLTLIELG